MTRLATEPSIKANRSCSPSTPLLMRECWFIISIGIADLITTVYWVTCHGAMEANPIFSQFLQMGLGWFIGMKAVMLAAPIILLEYACMKRPSLAKSGARFAIAAYVGSYIMGVAHLNPQLLAKPEPAGTRVAQAMPAEVSDAAGRNENSTSSLAISKSLKNSMKSMTD